MGIFLEEKYTNETENYTCGSNGVYETGYEDTGELFKVLKRKHGRCKGKVYRDGKDEEMEHVGWYFEKKQKHGDTGEEYLQGVWATLHEKEPITTTKCFPLVIK
jgi:hypothetical protein